MSKNKSKKLARMALGRNDDSPITANDLYKVSPPILTQAEMAHFDFGSCAAAALFEELETILSGSFRNGLAASDVAKILNGQGKTTACGARWNRRLAWFAMSLWRKSKNGGHSRKQTKGFKKDHIVDRAARRLEGQKLRKHRKEYFISPKIGEKFPELSALRKKLEGDSS